MRRLASRARHTLIAFPALAALAAKLDAPGDAPLGPPGFPGAWRGVVHGDMPGGDLPGMPVAAAEAWPPPRPADCVKDSELSTKPSIRPCQWINCTPVYTPLVKTRSRCPSCFGEI